MENTAHRAIAIVGAGAVLPDATNVNAFWTNIKNGRYSITDVNPERWDPTFYYDSDPTVPDKTYSKIGGWVREHVWDPMKWRLPIPPRVVAAMDESQKWAISCTREALEDYGYPERPLNTDRTAVILGNAMAGEKHYFTALRLYFPEYAHELAESASFAALPEAIRRDITRELHARMTGRIPDVTEDTMPGELSNCIAGRIANTFNFHGPNYVVDAACASAMAAFSAAVEGLIEHDFDVAVTGGIDRNMGASTFVKFCKIGALSATGTRPFARGADGFVMGEGAAVFLLKRLADAERDGDKIYAVLRGIAGSSDGKGKGITAPNPVGQKLSVERAWENAGLSPATATYIEGHGTSTRVGDVVEVQCMGEVLSSYHLPEHSVALGSVKSNIGHLKAAAGAAGLLKTALALRDKVLPPSVQCEHPNPDIDFAHLPLYVNTELKPWDVPGETPRRAGVSAFGFGGTNFHVVLEEHLPHKLNGNGKRSVVVGAIPPITQHEGSMNAKDGFTYKAPLRGALVIGATTAAALADRLREIQKSAQAGVVPPLAAPSEADLRAPERLVIDYSDAADLTEKSAKALKALPADLGPVWKALRAQGIYRGRGVAPKVAFLYTGQGSQYVNMLRPLFSSEPIVAQTFAEANQVMTPLLGKPLTDFIFVDQADTKAVAKAEDDLRQTAITQPAVLATDEALTRLLAAYGIRPDMTMGHSLGEYGALVASGALPFNDALEAVSARGRGMTAVAMDDNGKMAAILAPLPEIERILNTIKGYVVIANINSNCQAVIGGASKAVDEAMEAFRAAGYDPVALPVSHAFHTSIVAGAGVPLRKELERLRITSPQIPIVANVDGEFYPMGPNVVPKMLDILTQQVAAPVQFVKGLRTLYDAGARVFVEVGPKKALQGFAEDVLGEHGDVISLFTNHPKVGDVISFNQALCALYAAGLGKGVATAAQPTPPPEIPVAPELPTVSAVAAGVPPATAVQVDGDRYNELGHFFADVLERGWNLYRRDKPAPRSEPVVITGAALGLPGTEHIFDDSNLERILRGDQFIHAIPSNLRQAMLDKNITRLVKSDNGGPTFEAINNLSDVIKLAARGNAFDLEKEFGVSADRLAALDRVTQLAIASGIDALRDAGIPLVMRYKTTSKGTQLPDRWALPESLRDDTGVIFGSAFPGCDSFADEMSRYYADHWRRQQLTTLEEIRSGLVPPNGHAKAVAELDRRIEELRATITAQTYVFDRRFLFRVLSMGHSQFAEFIGARGPNTQINSACATTTQAISLAEDWIRTGRCRRVIIISADDVTSDHNLEWFGAGFLASGAAATDEKVEDAAIPFDRRRHGLLIGMGAAALVVESAEAARERGLRPICEVLGTVTANSAFHGTRLDVQHIGELMEKLVSEVEFRHGISRRDIAPRTMFMSHETYTPARGGSASAEIHALRRVFGESANQIVIANTKGFTGHAMATGIEDVVAVKALETSVVPPVANFKEVDPELGLLNLSKGGQYPVEYALRLGAGFGSQISLTLLRWTQTPDKVRPTPNALGYAYRVTVPTKWTEWLSSGAGTPHVDLEVVHHTLRVKDQASAAHKPVTLVEAQIPGPAVATHPPVPIPTPEMSTRVPAHEKESIESVEQRVLTLVAEKTGYPPEMLDLDLDLEADLGVDTVKQAEVFAAVREAYGIARDDQIKLRDFPTLAHVIRFVHQRRPDLVAPSAPASVAQEEQTITPAKIQPVAESSVRERVLALVVEKTGYPKDMLDLDLDLEADLGVDTVKQAEMFAAIREIYNIPRDENRKLRDYPTLAHVIRFVYDKRPDLADANPSTPPAAPPVSVKAPTTVPISDDLIKEKVLEIVAEKTGYPKDMLDLDLDLEADLGVDTVKQAEMFAAVRAAYNIPRDENLKLRDFPTLAHVIKFARDRQPGAPVMAPPAATPASAAVTPPADTDALIKEKVLAIVAEKTGYPKDMLDLDLDLEADLGVDTVKQAEMFAAVRAAYNIPRDENLKLRDFPTLAHVIQFARDRQQGASLMAPPAATPASAAATPPVPDTDALIKEKVLAIVAEKTGYPKDMLDLDLDLEADLGVDTVKQAEMFAAVRAAYNIPRDENLKLRDFPTLAHVIKFARDRQQVRAASPVIAEPLKAPTTVKVPLATFDSANAIPRRVPTPILRPPLESCEGTGVALSSGRRVVIMPDRSGVADALTKHLQGLGVETLRIDDASNAGKLNSRLQTWLAAGPIHGVYWLPAMDAEGNLGEMDLTAWRDALNLRVKSLFTTMRTLYEQVASAGSFLISATRLGGLHGYGDAGALAPLGGAVTGFTKTYKRERPEALVKAVDFGSNLKPEEIADLLVRETLRDPGAVEIGHKSGLRWTIALEERSAVDGQPGLILNKNSVFVITGAAGSIVSAITADLAAASGGTFYLLDLVPEPDPGNPDLKRFATDKENLKRDLFSRIQKRGERATPALVEKELAVLERAQAACSAIQAVRAAGGTAHYFSVNLTDAAGVAKVIDKVREKSGHIDVLLHAAGLERSHFLPDKDSSEFDLVFDVKSDGWFNLLHSIGDMPLASTVAFSSIAGRFGNAGQADYSSANDLLCKITSSFRSTRPNTRGIVIDWTAWGGIGMATRGSIPKMMELAGIDMLPPDAGIPLIRRELTAGGTRGEIVIAQRLGVLEKELHPTGGLDISTLAAVPEKSARGPMIGKIVSMTQQGLMVETPLDPKQQPFLRDHQIDGTAVLPGVMGIEAFAEASLALLPGWHIDRLEDVNFLAPFKFYRNDPRTVILEARVHPQNDALIADCRLLGRRNLPGQAEPQVTTHFAGRAHLARQSRSAQSTQVLGRPEGVLIEAAEVYGLYFHGAAYQVIERAWWNGRQLIGLFNSKLPDNHHPSDQPTRMAPRLIELCFQTAGLWEMGVQGRMGLPLHLDEVLLTRSPEASDGPLYAVITPRPSRGAFDAEVVDAIGNRYMQLTGYRTVALAGAVDPKRLKALQAIMTLESAVA